MSAGADKLQLFVAGNYEQQFRKKEIVNEFGGITEFKKSFE